MANASPTLPVGIVKARGTKRATGSIERSAAGRRHPHPPGVCVRCVRATAPRLSTVRVRDEPWLPVALARIGVIVGPTLLITRAYACAPVFLEGHSLDVGGHVIVGLLVGVPAGMAAVWARWWYARGTSLAVDLGLCDRCDAEHVSHDDDVDEEARWRATALSVLCGGWIFTWADKPGWLVWILLSALVAVLSFSARVTRPSLVQVTRARPARLDVAGEAAVIDHLLQR